MATHCWRSRDELISDVLLWIPSHGWVKARWPARTYIQQLCTDMGCNLEDLSEAMDDRERGWERVRDIRADGATSWWYICVYECLCVCVCGQRSVINKWNFYKLQIPINSLISQCRHIWNKRDGDKTGIMIIIARSSIQEKPHTYPQAKSQFAKGSMSIFFFLVKKKVWNGWNGVEMRRREKTK